MLSNELKPLYAHQSTVAGCILLQVLHDKKEGKKMSDETVRSILLAQYKYNDVISERLIIGFSSDNKNAMSNILESLVESLRRLPQFWGITAAYIGIGWISES